MSIYDKLNEQQKDAVFTVNGPLLILAGAGSGKTSVLTHRIAYLIDEAGVNPYNILAITFTNKAAGEMRERVDRIVGYGSEQIFVSTFHSMCVRILRRYAESIGYDRNFAIYDTDDQKTLMKDICKRLQIDTKQLKERSILNYISSAKDELITPEQFMIQAQGDPNKKKVASCYMEYQAQLRKNNAMDFDDLLMKTVELFKHVPEALEYYQNRFHYIMVDEYQDTNNAQFELIRLMADAHHNLCVVGDDDQSIYKFRGANIRNILDFERYYTDAKVVKLEQNYRSVQNVLSAANAVIRNNAARKDKTLWSAKEDGERIHFRQFDMASEESEYVCSAIRKSVREGESSYSENAILYRTNAQSRAIEEELVKCNMPYRIVGGINFYSRREIKDLLSYLKTVDNGKDDLAVKRILNVPKRGIGATTINKISDGADTHNTSFFESLRNYGWDESIKGATKEKLHSFDLMIERFRVIAQERGLSALMREILEVTDYITQMDVESEEEAQERIDNIEEFISKIKIYEEEAEHPNLSEFLEEVSLVADIDSVDENEERILLMTIHSAKGLEFKKVFLIGMEDGLFPSYMSISSGDEEIQEERRLAYVGITRAKESLTLTCARARMIHGETQYNPVSRFVREIPKNLFDIAPTPLKRYDDDYSYSRSDDSYSGFNRADSGFRRNSDSQDSYGGFRRNSDDSSSYGGFRRNAEVNTESSYSGFRRDVDYSSKVSPFQTKLVSPSERKTSVEKKPFIATATAASSFMKGADLKTTSTDYTKGDRVKHVKFGEGTVLNIVDEPRDKKVTVQFDAYGQKVMYASFAKLQKL